jgi:hypothetical protein
MERSAISATLPPIRRTVLSSRKRCESSRNGSPRRAIPMAGLSAHRDRATFKTRRRALQMPPSIHICCRPVAQTASSPSRRRPPAGRPVHGGQGGIEPRKSAVCAAVSGEWRLARGKLLRPRGLELFATRPQRDRGRHREARQVVASRNQCAVAPLRRQCGWPFTRVQDGGIVP